MTEILATIVPAVQRLLSRHGLEDEDVADPFTEAPPNSTTEASVASSRMVPPV